MCGEVQDEGGCGSGCDGSGGNGVDVDWWWWGLWAREEPLKPTNVTDNHTFNLITANHSSLYYSRCQTITGQYTTDT